MKIPRMSSIFIWRRPSSSRLYGVVSFSCVALFFFPHKVLTQVLTLIFFLSFLPTKYIVKSVVFVIGFIFWHVVPVILALPSSEKKRSDSIVSPGPGFYLIIYVITRLPPLFDNIPTDAEYAMELISQRVAAGLDTRPTQSRKKHLNSDSVESLDSVSKDTKGSLSQSSKDNAIDWKKWGDRVAIGKSAIGDIKRLNPGKTVSPLRILLASLLLTRLFKWVVHEVWPPRHPIIPGAIGIAQPQLNTEMHSQLQDLLSYYSPDMDDHLLLQPIPVSTVRLRGY
jgi:hypothetical protein